MRNIYLCQLSLIAVQCQLRCQFTFPAPFDISPPLSLQCSLTFHFRPALSSISARYGVRFPLCASANAQPTVAEIDSLSNLSACLSLCLSVRLLVCHLSVSPSVSLVLPARREYLNCGIFVAFEVKVFAFDFGYKVDSTSPPFPPPLLLASCYLCENFACLPFRFPSLTLNASPRISLALVCVQCVCPSVHVHRRVFACPSPAFGISICNI